MRPLRRAGGVSGLAERTAVSQGDAMQSMRTHYRIAYATADAWVGEYEMREGRAIPSLLAIQLEQGGWGDWFQWRTSKRRKVLTAGQLAAERAVQSRLRKEARHVPCARPVRIGNESVRTR
jgi:hypothetical protein